MNMPTRFAEVACECKRRDPPAAGRADGPDHVGGLCREREPGPDTHIDVSFPLVLTALGL